MDENKPLQAQIEELINLYVELVQRQSVIITALRTYKEYSELELKGDKPDYCRKRDIEALKIYIISEASKYDLLDLKYSIEEIEREIFDGKIAEMKDMNCQAKFGALLSMRKIMDNIKLSDDKLSDDKES